MCHDSSPYGVSNENDLLSAPSNGTLVVTGLGGAMDLVTVGTGAFGKAARGLNLGANTSLSLGTSVAYDKVTFDSVETAWRAGYATRGDVTQSKACWIPGGNIGTMMVYAFGPALGLEYATPR